MSPTLGTMEEGTMVITQQWQHVQQWQMMEYDLKSSEYISMSQSYLRQSGI